MCLLLALILDFIDIMLLSSKIRIYDLIDILTLSDLKCKLLQFKHQLKPKILCPRV